MLLGIVSIAHNGIHLSLSGVDTNYGFQFTHDSLKLTPDGSGACRSLDCGPISTVLRAGHPFAPTARENLHCIVPSAGLGPSIAAVANSGWCSRTCSTRSPGIFV